MTLAEQNNTRFFAVVGAAYIPEHHLDNCRDNIERHNRNELEGRASPRSETSSTGWWSQACH
jgi:hypothetical protein